MPADSESRSRTNLTFLQVFGKLTGPEGLLRCPLKSRPPACDQPDTAGAAQTQERESGCDRCCGGSFTSFRFTIVWDVLL